MSGEREPLLGHAGTSRRSGGHGSERSEIENIEHTGSVSPEASRGAMKKYVKECCNKEAALNKLPIVKWLPKYS